VSPHSLQSICSPSIVTRLSVYAPGDYSYMQGPIAPGCFIRLLVATSTEVMGIQLWQDFPLFNQRPCTSSRRHHPMKVAHPKSALHMLLQVGMEGRQLTCRTNLPQGCLSTSRLQQQLQMQSTLPSPVNTTVKLSSVTHGLTCFCLRPPMSKVLQTS